MLPQAHLSCSTPKRASDVLCERVEWGGWGRARDATEDKPATEDKEATEDEEATENEEAKGWQITSPITGGARVYGRLAHMLVQSFKPGLGSCCGQFLRLCLYSACFSAHTRCSSPSDAQAEDIPQMQPMADRVLIKVGQGGGC